MQGEEVAKLSLTNNSSEQQNYCAALVCGGYEQQGGVVNAYNRTNAGTGAGSAIYGGQNGPSLSLDASSTFRSYCSSTYTNDWEGYNYDSGCGLYLGKDYSEGVADAIKIDDGACLYATGTAIAYYSDFGSSLGEGVACKGSTEYGVKGPEDEASWSEDNSAYLVGDAPAKTLQVGELTALKSYTATCYPAKHGSITFDGGVSSGTFEDDEEVTLTVTPDSGYKVYEIYITGTSESAQSQQVTYSLDSSGNKVYRFNMISDNAIVTATFLHDSQYTIRHLEEETGESCPFDYKVYTADHEEATQSSSGQQLYVVIDDLPADVNIIFCAYMKDDGSFSSYQTMEELDEGVYRFTMPDYNVLVGFNYRQTKGAKVVAATDDGNEYYSNLQDAINDTA